MAVVVFRLFRESASFPAVAETPIEIRIDGKTYRVRSSATEAEVHQLAEEVNRAIDSIKQEGRALAQPSAQKTLLLAALRLAHELREERSRKEEIADKFRSVLTGLLAKVDVALLGQGRNKARPTSESVSFTSSDNDQSPWPETPPSSEKQKVLKGSRAKRLQGETTGE
ncbi:MAG: cell division protein ZapA [Polyangiaceae bacterium]|nr:cell division protein ZapA [Polyangiaceae bacterium]